MALIEQSLYTIPAGSTFTWTVYEASTQSGTYAQIWQGVTTPTLTTGWIASPPISNLTLKAGYYYAVALNWSTTSYVYYQLQSGSTYFPVTLSFGSLTAGYNNTSSTSPATTLTYYSSSTYSYEFPQRFTTTAP